MAGAYTVTVLIIGYYSYKMFRVNFLVLGSLAGVLCALFSMRQGFTTHSLLEISAAVVLMIFVLIAAWADHPQGGGKYGLYPFYVKTRELLFWLSPLILGGTLLVRRKLFLSAYAYYLVLLAFFSSYLWGGFHGHIRYLGFFIAEAT